MSTSRKKIAAGNWKMNTTLPEAQELFEAIVRMLPDVSHSTSVVVAPPYPFIPVASKLFRNQNNLFMAAQNCSSEEMGAFTGEVSAEMLRSLAVQYVILGHSERRKYFNETGDVIYRKLALSLKYSLRPICCVGESLKQREAGEQKDVVREQLEETAFMFDARQVGKIVIAYEPVWAIGTGKTATPEQAQDMHAHIRTLLTDRYGKEAAEGISILYGGSCNSRNAAELFKCKDIDGGLIGGASLKAEEFIAIAQSL